MKITLADVHVVLQAGGEGRRIRAVDAHTPKPMLTVGDVPLIERLMRQLVSAGLRIFTIVLGHEAATIRSHVRAVADSLPRDVILSFYEESRPLGNAGAIADIKSNAPTLLLAFADLFTQIDFGRLLHLHWERRGDVTLASHFEEYRLALGELITDGEQVRDYYEKPQKSFLICSGIAALELRVVEAARELRTPFGLSDLVRCALERSYTVTHWTHGSLWLDVNTPEALEEARSRVQGL